MQTSIRIPTADGHTIYGTLDYTAPKGDKLIIFVHGFTGFADEHFFFNAARFFPQYGYDTFRFNLYWPEDDARKLTESTVSQHIEDFQTVADRFKGEYGCIYAVGHSLGAQIIIRSGEHASLLKAAVLWDPSEEVSKMCESFDFDEKTGNYIEHSHVDIVIGKNFVEDARRLPAIVRALARYDVPTKVIGAGLAGAKIAETIYFPNLHEPKGLHVINGSGHTFDEGDSEKELFEETLAWLNMY